jgi:molecular chaperone DnaK
MAQYNKKLGMFELTGLPPAPRGVPQIEVDLRHRRQRHRARLRQGPRHRQGAAHDHLRRQRAAQGRGRADDERGEEYAEEDKQAARRGETRNSAEALVFQTEKFLGENGDKLPAEGKADVESA